jgi:hypothetical protein
MEMVKPGYITLVHAQEASGPPGCPAVVVVHYESTDGEHIIEIPVERFRALGLENAVRSGCRMPVALL